MLNDCCSRHQCTNLSYIEYNYIIDPTLRLNIINEDPDDNRVLECAVACKADYIVSGDKHLLALEKFKGIKIVTPKDFLSLIERNL